MMKPSIRLPLAAAAICSSLLVSQAGCSETGTINAIVAAEAQTRESPPQIRDAEQPAEDVKIAAIIEANSKVLDEIGKIAALMEESSDIIMRFNHFTDGHTKRVKLCPECWPPPAVDDSAEIEDPEETIPETMGQLLKDSKELHMSMQRFRGHLSTQKFALGRHLKKLREGKLPSQDAQSDVE